MKKTFLNLLVLLISFSYNAQSLKTPAKSPMSTVKQAVGLSDISIEYGRPSKNNRTIFGDFLPFGELWRTGANSPTKITFGEDVKVNGKDIKAGTYSLFTIPNQNEWTIIFNSNMEVWGTDGYKEADDVARFLVKTTKLNEIVESFTIQFSNLKPTELTVDLMWDQTKVSFDVSVSVDDKIMKNIESVMLKDKRPYHQAATYYYDNKKDMKQALEWATKAFELNPKAYWSGLLKAKIQLDLNDKKGAIATAEQVKKLATEDKDNAYIKGADEVIAKAKK
jgi:tetratricopeptide (TPR) repeat protein